MHFPASAYSAFPSKKCIWGNVKVVRFFCLLRGCGGAFGAAAPHIAYSLPALYYFLPGCTIEKQMGVFGITLSLAGVGETLSIPLADLSEGLYYVAVYITENGRVRPVRRSSSVPKQVYESCHLRISLFVSRWRELPSLSGAPSFVLGSR